MHIVAMSQVCVCERVREKEGEIEEVCAINALGNLVTGKTG